MKRLSTYQLFAVLVVLYALVILLVPSNHTTVTTYQLGGESYRILLFATVGLPAMLTWLAAFYGYEELRRYTNLVEDTREGSPFATLTRGVKWLALYLPVVSIVSLVLFGIANRHPGFIGASVIISNYLTILIALVAYSAISLGSRQLSEQAKSRPSHLKIRLLSLGFIIMGVLYCYFIFRHGLDAAGSPYHMPIGLMLVTVVVPFFYAWFLGLLAVLDIDAFATKTKGVLYRQALQRMSAGILVVVASSVLVQYVNSASPDKGRLMLGWLLLVRYLLYGVLAGGFALVANSAKKLQQIEKI